MSNPTSPKTPIPTKDKDTKDTASGVSSAVVTPTTTPSNAPTPAHTNGSNGKSTPTSLMDTPKGDTMPAKSDALPTKTTLPHPVTGGYDALNDPALVSAWRRFLDYDRVSSDQKKSYQRIREWVIAMYFITATGAVFSVMFKDSQYVESMPWLSGLMQLALIILPIVSVALNNYAGQFASSTAWIEYRVGAETIRQKIYLYRMKAGDFANIPSLQERQRKLLDVINEADQRIDKANATLPYMEPLENDTKPNNSIHNRVADRTDRRFDPKHPEKPYDDGFTEIPVNSYLDFRIRNQVDWYARRIQSDYSDMKRYRLVALVIGAAGAVIAALGNGLEGFVAITTAAGVALNMRADSRMYGATYATYHLTASRLRNELNQWDILTAQEQSDGVKGAELVAKMERILFDEREAWRSSAIELQTTADRSVNANIKTEGNEIAVKTGMTSSVKDYPSLVDNTTVEPIASTTVVTLPTPALLDADDSTSVASTNDTSSGFPGAGG
jgi:hypothetical protein